MLLLAVTAALLLPGCGAARLVRPPTMRAAQRLAAARLNTSQERRSACVLPGDEPLDAERFAEDLRKTGLFVAVTLADSAPEGSIRFSEVESRFDGPSLEGLVVLLTLGLVPVRYRRSRVSEFVITDPVTGAGLRRAALVEESVLEGWASLLLLPDPDWRTAPAGGRVRAWDDCFASRILSAIEALRESEPEPVIQ